MWQNKFDSRLELEPQPSRYFLIYLFGLHGLVIVALLQPLQFSPLWQGALILIVVSSLLWHVYRYSRQRHAGISLIWRGDGLWNYRYGSRYLEDLQLLPATFVTRGLIILQWKSADGRRVTLPLAPDTLSAEQWHLLYLRLLYPDNRPVA